MSERTADMIEVQLRGLTLLVQKINSRMDGEIPNLDQALQTHRVLLVMVMQALMSRDEELAKTIPAVLDGMLELGRNSGLEGANAELEEVIKLISLPSHELVSRDLH